MLNMRLKHQAHAQHVLNAVFFKNTSNMWNKRIFLLVLKSPTQIGFDGAINLELNILCLGPFNILLITSGL
jgi:hypothetical protein